LAPFAVDIKGFFRKDALALVVHNQMSFPKKVFLSFYLLVRPGTQRQAGSLNIRCLEFVLNVDPVGSAGIFPNRSELDSVAPKGAKRSTDECRRGKED